MKWVRRGLLIVVLLVVIAVVVVYLALDSIVRSAVQTGATASLNVPTTLDAADVSPIGGTVGLSGLNVGSPPNYTALHMFSVGGLKVAVSYGQLMKNPIHITKIEIDDPQLVIEQSGGKLNLQALMDQMPASSTGSTGTAAPQPAAQPMKLIIDELDVNNAKVSFLAGLPGLSNPQDVTVPSLTLKNIGNADNAENGAAIKDVVMQVCTGLAGKAGQTAGLSSALTGQVNQVAGQLGQSFNSQFQGAVGQLGQNLGGAVNNTGQGLLNGLMNPGNKKGQ